MKTKVKVALNMAKLSVPDKINKARFIVVCLTGNANFTAPNPTLASITTAINLFEAAWNNAADGGKVKTATMHDKENALMVSITALAHYVEDTAAGEQSKITSSGMDVRQAGGRVSVTGLVAKLGKQSGSAVLTTVAVAHSVFIWQYSADPTTTTSWLTFNEGRKASVTIDNLTPGSKYWFRVRSIDAVGHPFGDAISMIVV